MYTYKINIDIDEYETFAKRQKQVTLLQSSNWAKVKDSWGSDRLAFYDNNTIVGTALLLTQPLPLGMTMLYIPRGPIIDYSNQSLIQFVLDTLKKIAKEKRAILVKFDPFIPLKHYQINEPNPDLAHGLNIVETLTKLGCDWTGRTVDLSENIQPRFQAVIKAENFSEAILSKSTQQIIRTARNKGVQIQFGHLNLLDDFTSLMKKTETRKSISLRNKTYYQKLLESYPDNSYITLATIDLEQRYKNLEQSLTITRQSMVNLENSQTKSKDSKLKQLQDESNRIIEEQQFLKKHMKSGPTVIPLAGTLTIEYAHTSENLYAGMDDEFRRYQAAVITWFETAKHAFEHGVEWQNLGGIENNLDGGLYHFKSKFNPFIEEYIGEFNLPISPLYHLFNLVYKIRKKIKK